MVHDGFLRSFILCLLFLFLTGCGPRPSILPVEAGTTLLFEDDFSTDSLERALSFHIAYLQGLSSEETIQIGDISYGQPELLASLVHFKELIATISDPHELTKRIRNDFRIVQAGGRSGSPWGEMLVTGYYEPVLEGSLTPVPPYVHPLYSAPSSLIRYPATSSKKTLKGRLDTHGSLVPYWTRAEIETEDRAKGYELVYLKDPFDAFILHVQGSGKIQLRDGTLKSIHYQTDNGREYNSIGKLLVDEGRMKLEDVSIPTIKKYLLDHPEEQERIFHHNSKFIFFQWEDNNGPYGSLGQPLTPGRSIAIDNEVLPASSVGFLMTSIPAINPSGVITGWQQLHRFVLPQDTGSAIRGAGRVDLFWGNGTEARISAGAMKEKGSLYFLIKK